jgi:hypothetical protein
MMPISRLPAAIISMVVTRTNLRPFLSAIRPNTMPPSGRIRNPTANTANVDSRAETGSVWLNIAAAMNGAKTA